MSTATSIFFLSLLISCTNNSNRYHELSGTLREKPVVFSTIAAIPVPEGYERVTVDRDSFTEWIRALSLKKDNLVHLYNGELKRNQSIQYAVLDVPVGDKDLQQCADAVMRLRAEYLFSQKRYAEIHFRDNAGKLYQWTKQNDRKGFEAYLENVFGWCNSASLEKELKPVSIKDIQPGDVFIKGGFPGHAMMVADMAENEKGQKIIMLLQSYMPAQEIHIVRNPMEADLSPWYLIDSSEFLITPAWTFRRDQLRGW